MEPCGFVRTHTLRRPDSASRWQPVKKATRRPVVRATRARPAGGRTIASSGDNRDLVRQSRDVSTASPPAPSSSSSPSSRARRRLRRGPRARSPSAVDVAVRPAPTAEPAPSAAPSGPPSAGATPDADAIYDAIEDQVVAHPRAPAQAPGRARSSSTRPSCGRCSPPSFDQDTPAGLPSPRTSGSTRRSGCSRPTPTCDALSLDLLEQRRRGLLPRRREQALRRVARAGGARARPSEIYFAHEYTHALQDQNFDDLQGLQHDVLDQSDRLARPGRRSTRATRPC